MFVRWGNTCSTSFCVTNGVKQGGIISPMLFNLYMDDLSLKLNGMQHLLNICKEYAFTHKLLYNGSK